MQIFRNFLLSAISFIAIFPQSRALVVRADTINPLATPSGIECEQIAPSIDKFVSKFIGKNTSGAQISIVKDGKIVFSKGYGLSDRDNRLPVNRATTFNYASISKLFIWVSAMQLVEQGKLTLDKDIREYLPKDYPLYIKSESPITFLNLMNHNAGFEAYWKYHSGSGQSKDFCSLEEATYNCYSGIQCFEPGKIQGYSNYGANLAAVIIEKISDMPFYEYVNENIFKPCGMNTCYPERNPIADVLHNKAVGYSCSYDRTFSITPVYSGDWLYASGSVVGTADDLSKFALALMPKEGECSPLFKSNETIKKMFKISYTPTGSELFSVHHGFWGTDGNYRGVGHTGCVEGMVSHFLVVPSEKFSVSILVNDESGWDIAYGVTSLLTGNDYTESTKFEGGTEIFEGEYVNARTQFVNRKKDFDIITIKSLDCENIKLETNMAFQKYHRIGQYLFENVTATRGKDFKAKLYFKVVNGEVEKVVTFKNDLIPITRLFREALPGRTEEIKNGKNF